MTIKDKKILVTGATGMLGSHLVKTLIQRGFAVRATYRRHHYEMQNLEWVNTDILDVIGLEEAMQDIEVVFHCAAQISFDPANAKELYKNNVEGTANVVNAAIAAKVKQLIHVSSVAAIGGTNNATITEKTEWQDNECHNAYAKTKRAAEMEVRRGELEGLEVYIVNPSIILGCGDWNSGSTEIFKKIYHRFPYYTEGVHGFVDVADVVQVMASFLEQPNRIKNGERYILNGANISYKQLFDMIAKGFSLPEPYKKVTPFMAGLVWRLSYIKGKLTGKPSMLTKGSAKIAQSNIRYDNSKILAALPDFHFQPMAQSINRICQELREKYGFNT